MTVYERSDRIGRVITLWNSRFQTSEINSGSTNQTDESEGIQFITSYNVGVTAPAKRNIGPV